MNEGRNAGITDERELFSYMARKIEEAGLLTDEFYRALLMQNLKDELVGHIGDESTTSCSRRAENGSAPTTRSCAALPQTDGVLDNELQGIHRVRPADHQQARGALPPLLRPRAVATAAPDCTWHRQSAHLCWRHPYLRAMVGGAARIGLDGEPAGEVSEEHAKCAKASMDAPAQEAQRGGSAGEGPARNVLLVMVQARCGQRCVA
jgi:hypothetical protein